MPTATQRRAGGEEVERVAARWIPPMPTTGSSTARRDRVDLLERDRPHRRARTGRRVPAAQPRRAASRGSSAIARSVLISETASAPGLLGRRGDRPRRRWRSA